jgi:hypothetical protein
MYIEGFNLMAILPKLRFIVSTSLYWVKFNIERARHMPLCHAYSNGTNVHLC